MANIIHSGETALPKANAGFFKKIIEQIKQLFYSFFSEVDEPETVQKDKLNVWAIRAGPQIEAMRESVARSFTPETGIEVHISSVVDEQKVLLAASSGTMPDLICGGLLSRAYDLSLRGALKNLREYPDFNEIAKRYNPEMFVPFIHDGGCYAMPEAANFWLMYYRTDILAKLHLSIPRTWDDVIDMLPILYDNDMTFNTLLANTGSLKPLVSMMPYLHQHGASLYSQSGDRVNFLEPEFSKAFVGMTEMYTKYSVDHTIGSFYVSFRDGKSPIGIGDFTTYLQLKNAAPELEGNWAIGPSIGVQLGDNLVYDQPSVASGCYIMKGSTRTDDAWDFIKWWLSTNTQTDFAMNLQLTYGHEFTWIPANMEALQQSPSFDDEMREVILNQFENIREIPLHPAHMLVERALSDAWNNSVFGGVAPLAALNKASINANRDITKKLKEFGYMDAGGTLLKPYRTASADQVRKWRETPK